MPDQPLKLCSCPPGFEDLEADVPTADPPAVPADPGPPVVPAVDEVWFGRAMLAIDFAAPLLKVVGGALAIDSDRLPPGILMTLIQQHADQLLDAIIRAAN